MLRHRASSQTVPDTIGSGKNTMNRWRRESWKLSNRSGYNDWGKNLSFQGVEEPRGRERLKSMTGKKNTRPLTRTALCLASLVLLCVLSGGADAQSFYEEVNLAIERGVHDLLSQQKEDGSFKVAYPGATGLNARYPMGITSLAIYALVKSGVSHDDPAINRALGSLRYQPYQYIYSVSVLILALDAMNDPDLDERICKAAEWIEDHLDPETNIWAYPDRNPDLSNTQYAGLALWVAEGHGFKTKTKTWTRVIEGAMALQNDFGGFGYREVTKHKSSGAMTTAGITVLTVATRSLEEAGRSNGLTRRAVKATEKAWEHLDRCFTGTGNFSGRNGVISQVFPSRSAAHHFYYLYGLERVAALSDRSRIGGRSWYQEGARCILHYESDTGGWGDLVNTSFALLFLKRATFSGMTKRSNLSGRIPRAEYWRFTTKKPPKDWEKPGFDDSEWSRGASGFGNFGTTCGAVRTGWKKTDIWVRRTVDWKGDSADDFNLFVRHDDAAEIYINGVNAKSMPQWNQRHEKLAIAPAARATIKKGPVLLSAHCENTGGAQILDIRLRDIGLMATRALEPEGKAHSRWWTSKPRAEVPFIRRWLVLGPIKNPDDSLLVDPLKPDLASVPPLEGTRTHGCVWKPARSNGDMFNFEEAVRPADHCLYCAATYLNVQEETEAVLWVGADDGLRVLFDNRVLLSHHSHSSTGPDRFGLPLRLRPGTHTLIVKVDERKGTAGVWARVTGTDGSVLPTVRPVLAPGAPDWSEVARAHPSLFTLDELLALLPADPLARIDFKKASDLERLSAATCASGFPGWIDRYRKKEDKIRQPNPGTKGVGIFKPLSVDHPARLIRKVRIPQGRELFVVRVSPEAIDAPARSACVVRLGVYADELKWIAQSRIEGGPCPSAKLWHVVSGSVAEYADRDVLLLIECAAVSDAKVSSYAFIDEIFLK